MQEQGTLEEEAAIPRSGASGLADVSSASRCRISNGACCTAYLLCNSGGPMGEFGAVSVVSGHIRGRDQHHAATGRNPLQ